VRRRPEHWFATRRNHYGDTPIWVIGPAGMDRQRGGRRASMLEDVEQVAALDVEDDILEPDAALLSGA
jgi:hypothetical protein